jgi:hypothetical protein
MSDHEETYDALVMWHLSLGYDREASIRLALWCLDDSKAPRWTHMERETP